MVLNRIGQRIRVAGFASWAVIALLALARALEAGDLPASSVWRVQGASAAVYLAGTVHLLRETDHPIPPVFDAAFARCASVYFEVDLKQMELPETRRRMMELSLLPDGVALADRVSGEVYAKLRAFLHQAGYPSTSQFDHLKPGIAAMSLASIEAVRLGARADLGVEPLFDRKARAAGKKTVGLETVELQMQLFDQLTAAEQEDLLRLTVENIHDTEKDLPDLIDAWKRGQAAKLDEVLNRHLQGHERLMEVILRDRNLTWMPVVEQALRSESGDSMFLVGVGHLVGPHGLVRLLEAKGYPVVQWIPGR